MEKMTVVVGKTTGHVLGALTRVADPEGKLEAADLVGDGLPLRNPQDGSEWLTVDARQLTVEVVDLAEPALLQPDRYRVDGGVAVVQAALPANTVKLERTFVSVSLARALVSEEMKVVVLIEGPGDVRLTKELTIPAATPISPDPIVATEPIQIAAETYRTLALVPDFGASFEEITVL